MKKETQLTGQQFTALSTLAYYCLLKHGNNNKIESDYCKVSAVAHLCALIGIHDDEITAVRNGEIKGLQNISRFSDPVYYSDNYQFNPYN